MAYPCQMLTCHIYLFSDNDIYLSHADMSYILIYLLSAKMTYTSEFLKFVGPSRKKITSTGNSAKDAGPGVRHNFLFVYFVLHWKSEMQLVCLNDHGQLRIRFCFK